MESRLRDLYREIAETVDEMIPEEWNQFYFYAQISETGGGTYFFYEPEEEEGQYYYSLRIPRIFEIDEEEFEKNEDKLFDIAERMRKIFKEEEQELWYSFTFMLTAEGQMKVSFDYTDWFETEYSFNDLLDIWKYKYLGYESEDEETKALIEKYLEEYPDNPI